jgi:hypothetical protein
MVEPLLLVTLSSSVNETIQHTQSTQLIAAVQTQLFVINILALFQSLQ